MAEDKKTEQKKEAPTSEPKNEPVRSNEEVQALRQQISYLQSMIEATADPAKLRHIKEQEMKALERSGVKELKVNVHRFEEKYVTGWDSIPPSMHKVYKNQFGNLVEEIYIPNIRLHNPETGKEEVIEKMEYGTFHKTRGYTSAVVLEKITRQIDEESKTVYKVKVDETGDEFEIEETFVN